LPNSTLRVPVIGKVTREPLCLDQRATRILVNANLPKNAEDLAGYRGFLTTAKLPPHVRSIPTVSSLTEIDHLRTDDIVVVEPNNGFIRTLYRPDSDHNVIFTTQRCNSNCLMCSQPPQDRDDAEAMAQRNLRMIKLIDRPPRRLVITGGEPTLLGERLFDIITALRDEFPEAYLHMLTNGRIFAWPAFTARLAELNHRNFMLGIPVYSDDSTIHDYVVQAQGAFAGVSLSARVAPDADCKKVFDREGNSRYA
jgi:hypothetical protein